MFHKVSDLPEVFYPSMPVSIFKQLCDFISEKFDIVHFNEIDVKTKRPKAIITFDDGMQSIVDNCVTYMIRKNIKFTLNIDTEILVKRKPQSFIQVYDILNALTPVNTSYFDADFMKNPIVIDFNNPISTENQFTQVIGHLPHSDKEVFIKRMQTFFELEKYNQSDVVSLDWIISQKENALIEFGSHSHTHAIFSNLTKNQVIDECTKSKKILEFALNREINIFAYPNGVDEEWIDDLVCSCGYKYILKTKDTINELADLHCDSNKMKFFRVNQYHSSFEKALAHTFLFSKLRK
jgi:peptidoglycan/xylan/chitin deacetylase (PgdA/CDA1 family)